MYDRVLVPIDEGVVSTDAVDEAIRLAGDGGTIYGLYVQLPAARRDDSYEAKSESRLDELEAAADKANVPTVLEVRTGAPAETICGYAEENNIDIIVMGTHARKGLKNLLIGSVTEDTIRNAPCPVLAVPHHAVEDE